MSLRYCGYCEKPITRDAVMIPDDGERGTHALMYWHKLGDPECVRHRPLAPELAEPHVGGLRQNPRRAAGRRAP
ncbi:hypothetical protein ACFY7C_11815 [Streptomyces sp. NPDC012769]|uniref:hypothetical protein n=1 Tax=Streptomyces sp. NPDC012769 TaxID=3364848 RepID=UPI0036D09C66